MDYLVIALTIIFAASLTFFSGFGLGTIMLPVFSLFFDLPVAVGATAVVHLANNLFKFALVSKFIHLPTLFRFGIPALIMASVGGYVLTLFEDMAVITSYTIGEYTFEMTTIHIVIGSLMIFFAWFDLDPRFDNLNVKAKHIPFGGALSGFFGGISGHQGAFRAAFLSKAGLTKEQFIGTSNAVSLVVDLARLTIYLYIASALSGERNKFLVAFSEGRDLLIVGIVFAFLGTYLGRQLVKKTTITGIQRTVGVLLFIMGALMIAGIL